MSPIIGLHNLTDRELIRLADPTDDYTAELCIRLETALNQLRSVKQELDGTAECY